MTAAERRDRNAELIEPVTPLWIILGEYPGLVTDDDVLKEIAGGDPPTFGERDAVEQGIRDMLAAGVLRREGDSLVPTRATLFLDDHLAI